MGRWKECSSQNFRGATVLIADKLPVLREEARSEGTPREERGERSLRWGGGCGGRGRVWGSLRGFSRYRGGWGVRATGRRRRSRSMEDESSLKAAGNGSRGRPDPLRPRLQPSATAPVRVSGLGFQWLVPPESFRLQRCKTRRKQRAAAKGTSRSRRQDAASRAPVATIAVGWGAG